MLEAALIFTLINKVHLPKIYYEPRKVSLFLALNPNYYYTTNGWIDLANLCCRALWTDARECIQCGEDYWSNEIRDLCLPKIIEFLAFGEPLGITLIVISAFGALITIGVMVCV